MHKAISLDKVLLAVQRGGAAYTSERGGCWIKSKHRLPPATQPPNQDKENFR